MAKYAINYTLTPIFEANYVIEAENELEARRLAEELLGDGDFTYELASEMYQSDEGTYEIGEVLKLDSDTTAMTNKFFFERG